MSSGSRLSPHGLRHKDEWGNNSWEVETRWAARKSKFRRPRGWIFGPCTSSPPPISQSPPKDYGGSFSFTFCAPGWLTEKAPRTRCYDSKVHPQCRSFGAYRWPLVLWLFVGVCWENSTTLSPSFLYVDSNNFWRCKFSWISVFTLITSCFWAFVVRIAVSYLLCEQFLLSLCFLTLYNSARFSAEEFC